jgi:hypothetical protein
VFQATAFRRLPPFLLNSSIHRQHGLFSLSLASRSLAAPSVSFPLDPSPQLASTFLPPPSPGTPGSSDHTSTTRMLGKGLALRDLTLVLRKMPVTRYWWLSPASSAVPSSFRITCIIIRLDQSSATRRCIAAPAGGVICLHCKRKSIMRPSSDSRPDPSCTSFAGARSLPVDIQADSHRATLTFTQSCIAGRDDGCLVSEGSPPLVHRIVDRSGALLVGQGDGEHTQSENRKASGTAAGPNLAACLLCLRAMPILWASSWVEMQPTQAVLRDLDIPPTSTAPLPGHEIVNTQLAYPKPAASLGVFIKRMLRPSNS